MRPCIVARQVRDTLQLGDLPGAQRLRFRADGAHLLLARIEVVIALLQLRRLAVERLFLLLDAALLPLRIGALLLQFSLDLLAEVERIILGGERQFPLFRLRCFDNPSASAWASSRSSRPLVSLMREATTQAAARPMASPKSGPPVLRRLPI